MYAELPGESTRNYWNGICQNGITDILFTKQSSIDGDMYLLEEVEQAAFWMF